MIRAMRAGLFLLLSAAVCNAEWIRVSSPGLEVWTDAGERTGRQILARCEQVRGVFRDDKLANSPLPVRVFAFSSNTEFHTYLENQIDSGFYLNGGERDYIALYAGADRDRVAFHEFVHLILNHSSVPMPKWFEEGTAEFYSTLRLDRDHATVGGAIEPHLEILKEDRRLGAAELMGVDASSLYYTERHRAGIFYAQSWALVHMLNVAPGWREGLPRFLRLLADDQAPEKAFLAAFGKTLDQALRQLEAYVPAMHTISIPATAVAPSRVQVERVSAGESALARSDLAMHLNRPDVARFLLQKLPESAETSAGLGAVAMAEGRNDEAARKFQRAIELGGNGAAMYFEYAMLERDAGATPQRVRSLVEKAIAADRDFADAQFLLGVEDTDREAFASAIGHLQEAVRVRPRRTNYWYMLAYAQAQSGMKEDAERSRKRAAEFADTAADRQMTEALAGVEKREAHSPGKRLEVYTPPSWQDAKGDSRIEGVLTNVDCNQTPPRMEVQSESAKLSLQTHHPSEVRLVSAPREDYQFSCGPQQVRVIVEYRAAEGEITRIEFRP